MGEKSIDYRKIEQELERYPNIDLELKQLHERYQKILERKEEIESKFLKAPSLSGMPHGYEVSNPVLKLIEEMVDDIAIRLKDLNDRQRKLFDIQIRVEAGLEKLNVNEREFVTLRYFQRHRVNQVAVKMHYSEMQLNRMQNEVISKFAC